MDMARDVPMAPQVQSRDSPRLEISIGRVREGHIPEQSEDKVDQEIRTAACDHQYGYRRDYMYNPIVSVMSLSICWHSKHLQMMVNRSKKTKNKTAIVALCLSLSLSLSVKKRGAS